MIILRCEECGQSFRVKDQHAGKKTKCKASLRIPEPKPQQPEPKRVTRSVADDDWPVEADCHGTKARKNGLMTSGTITRTKTQRLHFRLVNEA